MFISSVTDPTLTIIKPYVRESVRAAVEDVKKSDNFSSAPSVRITIVALRILNPAEDSIMKEGKQQWIIRGRHDSIISVKILSIKELFVDTIVSDVLSKIQKQAPCLLDKIKVRIQLLEKQTPLSKIYETLMDFNLPKDSPSPMTQTTPNTGCIIL